MILKSVSIVVPVYNSAFYLKSLIQSIDSQNYNNLEVVFVDDGSTDDSLEIIDYYIKLYKLKAKIYSISNSGQSFARNYGLKNSSGELVCFVDSDDLLLDNYLDYMNELIQSGEYDFAAAGFVNFKDVSEIRIYQNSNEIETNKGSIFKSFLSKKIKIHHAAIVYKRSFLLENEIQFDTNLRFGEDTIFIWQSISASKQFIYSSKKVYAYLNRVDSVISTSKLNSILSFLERFKEKVDNNLIQLESNFSQLLINNTLLSVLRTIAKFSDYEIFDKFYTFYKINRMRISDFYGLKFKVIFLIVLLSPKNYYRLVRRIK